MEDQVDNYDLMIGYIYRISHLDSDICYIGSTLKPIRNRYHEHLQAYNLWLNGKDGTTIYPFFKQYGVKRFKISLVKEYEVVDTKHLHLYEQLWINKLRKTCVNKANTFAIRRFTRKAYQLANKDAIKENLEKNKDKIKERTNRYYEATKDAKRDKKKSILRS